MGHTFMAEFARVAGGAYDRELWGGEEDAGGCFGGHCERAHCHVGVEA